MRTLALPVFFLASPPPSYTLHLLYAIFFYPFVLRYKKGKKKQKGVGESESARHLLHQMASVHLKV